MPAKMRFLAVAVAKTEVLQLPLLIIIFLTATVHFAQQKHALIIGNNNYTGISPLKNPVNDANDMDATLRSLGFTVEKVLNGNLEQMENAVTNLKRRRKRQP